MLKDRRIEYDYSGYARICICFSKHQIFKAQLGGFLKGCWGVELGQYPKTSKLSDNFHTNETKQTNKKLLKALRQKQKEKLLFGRFA